MEEHLCLALQMRTVDHFFSLAAHRGRCVNLGPTSPGIHARRQFWNCIVVCEITKPRSSVPGQGCKDGSSKSTKLSCDHCGQRHCSQFMTAAGVLSAAPLRTGRECKVLWTMAVGHHGSSGQRLYWYDHKDSLSKNLLRLMRKRKLLVILPEVGSTITIEIRCRPLLLTLSTIQRRYSCIIEIEIMMGCQQVHLSYWVLAYHCESAFKYISKWMTWCLLYYASPMHWWCDTNNSPGLCWLVWVPFVRL